MSNSHNINVNSLHIEKSEYFLGYPRQKDHNPKNIALRSIKICILSVVFSFPTQRDFFRPDYCGVVSLNGSYTGG